MTLLLPPKTELVSLGNNLQNELQIIKLAKLISGMRMGQVDTGLAITEHY